MNKSSPRYLKLKEVLERFRVGKSKLYADIQRGLFPAPEKQGHSSFWAMATIEDFERKRRERAGR